MQNSNDFHNALTQAQYDLRREKERSALHAHNSNILECESRVARRKLAEVRMKPMKALADKVQFKVLNYLLNSGLLLSEKLTARFDKSARKRDPRRSLYDTDTSHDRNIDYAIWMRRVEPKHHFNSEEVMKINAQVASLEPFISVIMSVHDLLVEQLQNCIHSVLAQSFQNWQFCIVDDASTDPEISTLLKQFAAQDARIQVVSGLKKSGTCAVRNAALKTASGEFVALLNQGDTLPKHALAHIAQTIQNDPNAKLIYGDEDRVDTKGQRVDPHFKSGWNRDLFYSHNYVGSFAVLKKTLIDEVGGFSAEFVGACEYDLFLRAVALLRDENIARIPRILYHRHCVSEESHSAGKAALTAFLHCHENPDIFVEDGITKNTYHVIWPVPAKQPKVTLIIPTRDYKDLLETAVNSILDKTDYENYEIIIVDNGSVEPETLAWLESIQVVSPKVCVLHYDQPFNYSAINNFAAAQTDGDIIALVNNDVEVVNPGWLREMVSHAIRSDIGCVGAKLHYTNGQIQHGGVITGIGWMTGHSHKHYGGTSTGYFNRLVSTQNLSAVTGACLVLRRSVFEAVGGLDVENLSIAFNDIDLCLMVQATGVRNLWTPHAVLFHHESISRGYEDTPEKQARFQKEAAYMIEKWVPAQNLDRYYNPNLTNEREDFSIDIA